MKTHTCSIDRIFYIDPNHTLSISLDPTSNIDWAYLWGEHKDCGHGSQFVRKDIF